MNKQWASLLLIVAGIFTVPGRALADQRMAALEAIDRGQYESAIATLSGMLATNPADQRTRIQLASAYAARAGIRLENFIGLARELVNSSQGLERFYEERIAVLLDEYKRKSQSKPEVDAIETVDRIYRTSFRLANLLRQFSAVPLITDPSRVNDLNQAVFILSGDQSLRGGGALYRGLLRVSLIRSTIVLNQGALHLNRCRIDVQRAVNFITQLHTDVRLALIDISMATTKEKTRQEMARNISNLDQGVADILKRARSAAASSSDGEVDLSEIMVALKGRCE